MGSRHQSPPSFSDRERRSALEMAPSQSPNLRLPIFQEASGGAATQ